MNDHIAAQHSFVKGEEYTRKQINSVVGGSIQSYLPHKNGRVVCACLRDDLNPKAPDVILVGTGPDIYRSGVMLCEQGGAVPAFIKNKPNHWEFRGDYEVARWTDDPQAIREECKGANRRTAALAVYMNEVR